MPCKNYNWVIFLFKYFVKNLSTQKPEGELEFSETEKYANFTWKNEGLEEGTYDFRVFAEDQSENVSEEYVCSYRYSRDGDNGEQEDENTEDESKDDTSFEEGKYPENTVPIEAQVPRVELPSNYSLRVGKDYEFKVDIDKNSSDIKTFDWDFGNGDKASGESVVYRYIKDGEYELTLTVKDIAGKTATMTADVQVHICNSKFFIPVHMLNHLLRHFDMADCRIRDPQYWLF